MRRPAKPGKTRINPDHPDPPGSTRINPDKPGRVFNVTPGINPDEPGRVFKVNPDKPGRMFKVAESGTPRLPRGRCFTSVCDIFVHIRGMQSRALQRNRSTASLSQDVTQDVTHGSVDYSPPSTGAFAVPPPREPRVLHAVTCTSMQSIHSVTVTGCDTGCDTWVRRFVSAQTSGVHRLQLTVLGSLCCSPTTGATSFQLCATPCRHDSIGTCIERKATNAKSASQ